jgi:hypothetical protein
MFPSSYINDWNKNYNLQYLGYALMQGCENKIVNINKYNTYGIVKKLN